MKTNNIFDLIGDCNKKKWNESLVKDVIDIRLTHSHTHGNNLNYSWFENKNILQKPYKILKDLNLVNIDFKRTNKIIDVIENNKTFNDIWWDWLNNDDLQILPIEKLSLLIKTIVKEISQ